MKKLKRICLLLLLPIAGLALIGHFSACSSYGPSEAGKGTEAFAEAPKIVNEAPVPEGWPALTPVGQVRVKTYPTYRAAFIVADAENGGSDSGMFRPLFNHIQREDIAMTAPVKMTYDEAGRQRSMAFLYRTSDMGAAGIDGKDPRVQVRDVPEMTVLSIGVKGGYSHDRFSQHVAKLNAWLAEQDTYRAAGEARYLGYNSPFVFPSYRKYGEVQMPIEPIQ